MNSNETYTLSDYLAALRRRRGVFLTLAIPLLVGTAALSVLLPDKYTSYSRIDIDLEGTNVQTLEPIELTSYADQYVAKLQDRVLSADKLRALAVNPHIFPDATGEASESENLDRLDRGIDVEVITQPVMSPGRGREVELISGFQVAFVDRDPQLAYRVADHLAAQFMEADRTSRTERATSTSVFLREQMGVTEKEIVDLENELAQFKVKNACCLPELMDLNLTVIQRAERDIETVQPRIRTLQKDRQFLQAQLDELRQVAVSTDHLAELEREYFRLVANYGPDHPDLNRVRREIEAITSAGSGGSAALELVRLRMQLAEAQQKYSDEHPDIVRLNREIAALEARQDASSSAAQANRVDDPRYQQLQAQINTVDTELVELQTRLPALRQKIADYEERLARTPQIESDYEALNRRLSTARDNFESLQQRQVIARQTEALESAEIGARLTEVRPARVPSSPSGPPRLAIMVVGVFLAGTLGFGAMMFAEMADSTVRGSKDIAVIMEMVPLATIPVIENSLTQASRNRQIYLISFIVLVAAVVAVYFL